LFSSKLRLSKPKVKRSARGLPAIIDGKDVDDILLVCQAGEIIVMVNLLYSISNPWLKSGDT
jgi:hypothetical protein